MASVVSRIVEICIFRFAVNGIEYLMMKRAEQDQLYPGIWQWVTGTVLEGENALSAAQREFSEETGLSGLRLWIVPHVTMFYDSVHDCVHCSPLFAIQVESGVDPLLSSEHSEFRWATYAQAGQLLVWPGQRKGLDMVEKYIVTGEEGAGLLEMALK